MGGVIVLTIIGFLVWGCLKRRRNDYVPGQDEIKWPKSDAEAEELYPTAVRPTGGAGMMVERESSIRSSTAETSNYGPPNNGAKYAAYSSAAHSSNVEPQAWGNYHDYNNRNSAYEHQTYDGHTYENGFAQPDHPNVTSYPPSAPVEPAYISEPHTLPSNNYNPQPDDYSESLYRAQSPVDRQVGAIPAQAPVSPNRFDSVVDRRHPLTVVNNDR